MRCFQYAQDKNWAIKTQWEADQECMKTRLWRLRKFWVFCISKVCRNLPIGDTIWLIIRCILGKSAALNGVQFVLYNFISNWDRDLHKVCKWLTLRKLISRWFPYPATILCQHLYQILLRWKIHSNHFQYTMQGLIFMLRIQVVRYNGFDAGETTARNRGAGKQHFSYSKSAITRYKW